MDYQNNHDSLTLKDQVLDLVDYPGSTFICYGDSLLPQKNDFTLYHDDPFGFSAKMNHYTSNPLLFTKRRFSDETQTHQISFSGTLDVSTKDSSQNKFEYGIFAPQANFGINNDEISQEIKEPSTRHFTENKEEQSQTSQKISPKYVKSQSIYKNKYKEVLEQAKTILDELFEWTQEKYERAKMEKGKTLEEWIKDGELLKKIIEVFEKEEELLGIIQEEIDEKIVAKDFVDGMESKMLEQEIKEKKKEEQKIKKQVEPLRTKIIDALYFKQFSAFVPLYEKMDLVKLYIEKEDLSNFFKKYKVKCSMIYLEKCLEEEELFHWIVILKLALTLLPQDIKYLTSLPLTQTTTPFMAWLIESDKMKIKNKTLFKQFEIRNHLRKEFEKILRVLFMDAQNKKKQGKWENEKWEGLIGILNTLGGIGNLNILIQKDLSNSRVLDLSKRSSAERDNGGSELSDPEDEPCKLQKIVTDRE